ncbi:HipA domain-containing protein [Variovorax sp. J31P179]|uniref:HipA domain-containing protein n=1 Tax=Variovorax sp. J31P179 TaxID=3053508 RepID=UPI002578CE2E|nr:HipA domain-containing protein [Variovorax sp. J31P179]
MNNSSASKVQGEAERVALLRSALSQGPRSSVELLAMLQASQPTFSRTIQKLGPEVIRFREPGVRTPRYGLLRAEPVASPQPMFRVDAEGRVAEIGSVSFLRGGGTWVDAPGGTSSFHEGLAPAMAFAAPSGYPGARLAKAVAAALGVPPSLRDWSDDHRASFLCRLGADVGGALIWGADSFALHMASRRAAAVPAPDIQRVYRDLATGTAQTGAGSSAGGEQPKFTCETEARGHLIVKFARRASRSAELLVLEELALRSLSKAGIAAARAHYLELDDYGYLEVERFDRVGRFGRRGLISAGAVDDELFGMRDNWPAFAQRCEEARILDADAVRCVLVLAAFSELIGNGDRHFENLSLLTDDHDRPNALAPAYDMLPMVYAPVGGGIEPELRRVAPSFLGLGARTDVWQPAFEAARSFWAAAAADPRLSAPMRAISGANGMHVAEVVAPLLPAAPTR